MEPAPVALCPATPEALRAAGERLRRGGLVAFPTETVYGLGADATNAPAVAAIFAAKGRPRFNPLIVHVADMSRAALHARFSAQAEALAAAFWPGPLTLVLEKRGMSPVCDLATAGLATIALRIPSHPVARQLLLAADVPVAAPSANRSGHVSPTRAEHVVADLGAQDILILEGGATTVGLESTVVDVSGAVPVLLRPGGITRADIEAVLAAPVGIATGESDLPASPGMLARHYAPRTALRLNATRPGPGEAWLAFGPQDACHAGPAINLSAAGDLVEAAMHLFAALRTLDATGVPCIAVAPIPEQGLGEAINDRLRRAALGAGGAPPKDP